MKKLWPPEVGAPFREFSIFFENFVFRHLGSRSGIWGEFLEVGLGCDLWGICFKNWVSNHIGATKTGGQGGLWTNGAAAVVALSFFFR